MADRLCGPRFAVAMAAGCCRSAFEVEIKPGFRRFAAVYLAVVALPGTGKSAAFEQLAVPINLAHEAQLAKSEVLFTTDGTREGIVHVMGRPASSGAMFWMDDEISGMMSSMDQYRAKGAGGDRAFYLKSWSHAPVAILRRNVESPRIYVKRPCVTVAGGIQPSRLQALRSGDTVDDGWWDRWLLCYPADPPVDEENWQSADPKLAAEWKAAVNRLLGVDATVPKTLALSQGAQKAYHAFSRELKEVANNYENGWLRGPILKLREYTHRPRPGLPAAAAGPTATRTPRRCPKRSASRT